MKPFSQRVEVCYPDPMRDDDILVILAPFIRKNGKFICDDEKIPIMYRLLKGSSIRFSKSYAILLTPIWLWNTYLRTLAELSAKKLTA